MSRRRLTAYLFLILLLIVHLFLHPKQRIHHGQGPFNIVFQLTKESHAILCYYKMILLFNNSLHCSRNNSQRTLAHTTTAKRLTPMESKRRKSRSLFPKRVWTPNSFAIKSLRKSTTERRESRQERNNSIINILSHVIYYFLIL